MINVQKEALYAFVKKLGIPLVIIEDEIFGFTTFNPADKTVLKHLVVGKDLTAFFQTNSVSINFNNIDTQVQSLLGKLETQPLVRREFSPEQKWTTFLS